MKCWSTGRTTTTGTYLQRHQVFKLRHQVFSNMSYVKIRLHLHLQGVFVIVVLHFVKVHAVDIDDANTFFIPPLLLRHAQILFEQGTKRY